MALFSPFVVLLLQQYLSFFVLLRFVLFRFGAIRFGSVRFGSVRFDSVRFGSVRLFLPLPPIIVLVEAWFPNAAIRLGVLRLVVLLHSRPGPPLCGYFVCFRSM